MMDSTPIRLACARLNPRHRRDAAYSLVFMLLALLCSPHSHAVRPFVTDDARIIDVGQAEAETWLEAGRGGGRWDPAPAFNVMSGYTFNDWLEVIIGGGFGREPDNDFTIGNPLIQPKILLRKATVNGPPGHAIGVGATFDTGTGSMHHRGSNYYLLGITSYRLDDDRFNVHTNYGLRLDKERGGAQRVRPYWGLGLDVETFSPAHRFIIEAYAGDPLELNDPLYAGQLGVRWLKSEYLNFDLTMGLMPELDARRRNTGSIEGWIQLGIRFLFDINTLGGQPGRFDGADGLFGSRSSPAP
jgi:hypothetical protein